MELLKDPIGRLIKQLENGNQNMGKSIKMLPSPPPHPCPPIGKELPTPTIQTNISSMVTKQSVNQPDEQIKDVEASTPPATDQPSIKSIEAATPEEEDDDEEDDDKSNNKDLQEQEKRLAKAVFNFEGQEDELSFEKGQIITVIKSFNDGWLLGELEDGKQGIFPANYIKETTPASSNSTTQNEKKNNATLKPSASKTISLNFDEGESCSSPSKVIADSPNSSPSSPTHSATEEPAQRPQKLGQNRTFSYIPQLPPNGFAGLRKTNTTTKDNPDTELHNSIAKSECRECGCSDYSQNVFKRDSCNNCFHIH